MKSVISAHLAILIAATAYFDPLFTTNSSFGSFPKCQVSYDHPSYERNLTNCVLKPEKVRTSTGFEPVISRGRGFKPR